MNKSDLAKVIASSTGASMQTATKTLNELLDAIGNGLANGDSIQIVGFGTFKVNNRNAATRRNPRTGDVVNVPAKKVPTFKPGKALKDKLN